GTIEVRGSLDLYDLVREVSPILDVAILKLVQLVGDFRIDAMGNARAQEVLDATKKQVRVGWIDGGFSSFMTQMVDSAIAKGFALGELVPDALLKGVDRLKVARANDFRFMVDDTGRLAIGQMDKFGFRPVELADQSLIYYLAFDLRDGHPQGVSLLNSLPAVVKTVMRIQHAIDSTAWRVGDPTFLILQMAGDDQSADDLKSDLGAKAADLQEAMLTRKSGGLMDLGFGYAPNGKLEVKVLGGDAQLPDLTVPTKITMEQIVARTGLPPFMFGLSWSTTERMAKEQSDMLTSEVWARRSRMDSIIDRVFTTALLLNGLNGVKWKHEWDPVNLQDDEKTARARLQNATAQQKEIDARLALLDAALITPDAFVSYLVGHGIETEEAVKSAGGIDAIAAKYLDSKATRVAVMLTRSI
ncbi:MAG TPA: hypothetical protein PL181_17050, partial [bacterium]|nr:hypothetical protein [bacterium]